MAHRLSEQSSPPPWVLYSCLCLCQVYIARHVYVHTMVWCTYWAVVRCPDCHWGCTCHNDGRVIYIVARGVHFVWWCQARVSVERVWAWVGVVVVLYSAWWKFEWSQQACHPLTHNPPSPSHTNTQRMMFGLNIFYTDIINIYILYEWNNRGGGCVLLLFDRHDYFWVQLFFFSVAQWVVIIKYCSVEILYSKIIPCKFIYTAYTKMRLKSTRLLWYAVLSVLYLPYSYRNG